MMCSTFAVSYPSSAPSKGLATRVIFAEFVGFWISAGQRGRRACSTVGGEDFGCRIHSLREEDEGSRTLVRRDRDSSAQQCDLFKRDVVSIQKGFSRRIRDAGKRGRWKHVHDLLMEMRQGGVPRDIFVYNAAVNSLARCRRPLEAEELLRVMLCKDGIEPDVVSYNSAIKGYAKVADLDSVLRLVDTMRSRGVRPDIITFNTMVDAAAKRGDSAAAADVFLLMAEEHVVPDVITYNACLSACVKGGDWRRILEILSMMRTDGIALDLFSYSSVISAAGKCGKWKEALNLLKTMCDEGIKPDLVVFNSVLAALSEGRQWEKAKLLLREMPDAGVRPDVFSYCSVLAACNRAGQWEESLLLVEQMRASDMKPNGHIVSTTLTALGKSGRWQEALSLFDEAQRSGVTIDTAAFNSAIEACAASAKWEPALALHRRMRLHGPAPDTKSYGSAMVACARAGRAEEALGLLEELKSNMAPGEGGRGGLGSGGQRGRKGPVPDVMAYSAAFYACLQAGQPNRGLALLDEMLVEKMGVNEVHCRAVITSLASMGRPDQALSFMEKMPRLGLEIPIGCFEAVVSGFAQSGDWRATIELLAETVRRGLRPKVRLWDATIAAAGHWELALSLLADMRRVGIHPSKVTYTAAVAGLQRPRYAAWGSKLERLAQLLMQGNSLAQVVARDNEQGGTGEGEEGVTSRQRGDSTTAAAVAGPTAEDYEDPIIALGEAGDAGSASHLLRVMSREGFRPSSNSYRAVIYACARAGNLAGAAALVREMRSGAGAGAGGDEGEGREEGGQAMDAVDVYNCIISNFASGPRGVAAARRGNGKPRNGGRGAWRASI